MYINAVVKQVVRWSYLIYEESIKFHLGYENAFEVLKKFNAEILSNQSGLSCTPYFI